MAQIPLKFYKQFSGGKTLYDLLPSYNTKVQLNPIQYEAGRDLDLELESALWAGDCGEIGDVDSRREGRLTVIV